MSENTPKTVFIKKYALTDGIQEFAVIERDRFEKGSATVQWRQPGNGWGDGRETFYSKDFHDTREAAIARAEEMRKAKIASHERSIAKLRKLTFT